MTKKSKKPIIDGFQPIISRLGTKEQIIEFVLENTYFFDPELVKNQKESLKPPYYVRFSRKKSYFYKESGIEKESNSKDGRHLHKLLNLYIKRGDKNIDIVVDRDNNEKVKNEIKDYTGQVVSKGKRSTMKNFVITHIWGNATEPEYFSYMWNYCITPSFAASLTDKEDPEEDTVEKLLQDTIKAIAQKLYASCLPEINKNEEIGIQNSISEIQIKLLKKDRETIDYTVKF